MSIIKLYHSILLKKLIGRTRRSILGLGKPSLKKRKKYDICHLRGGGGGGKPEMTNVIFFLFFFNEGFPYKLNKMLSEDYVTKGSNGTSTMWMLEVNPDAGEYSTRYVRIYLHNKNATNLRVKMDVSLLNTQKVRSWTSSKSETSNTNSRIEMWCYSTGDLDRMIV